MYPPPHMTYSVSSSSYDTQGIVALYSTYKVTCILLLIHATQGIVALYSTCFPKVLNIVALYDTYNI